MLYIGFKHAHLALGCLAVLFTLLWSVVAWARTAPGASAGGALRPLYILNRATSGLAALTGLAIIAIGPWRQMLFPYLGLAAFLVHGFAATASKRALGTGQVQRMATSLVLQNVALWLAAWLMAAKSL